MEEALSCIMCYTTGGLITQGIKQQKKKKGTVDLIIYFISGNHQAVRCAVELKLMLGDVPRLTASAAPT